MKIRGIVKLKGDKSISHRALFFGALINDKSIIKNISLCSDVAATINALRKCHIKIEMKNNIVEIAGGTLKSPDSFLNMHNSGTTTRLMIGLLAGQNISAKFVGDSSLSSRPMGRILNSLTNSGANIVSNDNFLPIEILSGITAPIILKEKTKSAQVKSSLIFAALGEKAKSKICYNKFTRNHSEVFLDYLGFNVLDNNIIVAHKIKFNKGFDISIPGDISNAAFIIVAAMLIPGSRLTIKNLLNNKLRNGFLNIIKEMGANLQIENCSFKYGEEVCDLSVEYSPNLKNINLSGDRVITAIDEIPILAVLATQAKGTMIIDDAQELRIKETDRIKAILYNLKNMKADIQETDRGMIIRGDKILYSTTINDFGDHRIAMSFYILNLLLNHETINKNLEIANISFPEFHQTLKEIVV